MYPLFVLKNWLTLDTTRKISAPVSVKEHISGLWQLDKQLGAHVKGSALNKYNLVSLPSASWGQGYDKPC